MQPVNLSSLLEPYYDSGLFLAITRDRGRVVGTGKTIQDAAEAASQGGYNDPIIMRAPRRGFEKRLHL
jgi:hypothetical protein